MRSKWQPSTGVSQGLVLGPVLLNVSGSLDTDLARLGRTKDRTGLPFRGAVAGWEHELMETS